MAILEQRPKVVIDISLRLTEQEAAAFSLLAEYGQKDILAAFQSVIGESQMTRHAAGFASFLEGVKALVPPILSRAEKARAAFNDPT